MEGGQVSLTSGLGGPSTTESCILVSTADHAGEQGWLVSQAWANTAQSLQSLIHRPASLARCMCLKCLSRESDS